MRSSEFPSAHHEDQLMDNDFNHAIEILWEEPTALVVNKPAGILTQGAHGITTMETCLRDYLKSRDQHSGVPYVGLPHRLDRCVSGALLVARNVRAVQRFGAQFQSRKITKTYWAIAIGCVPTGVDETPLVTLQDIVRKVPGRPVAEIVDDSAPDGKQATLHYRLLRYLELPDGRTCSWLEVHLETGRMHQIRLQFASRGFPLLGDSTYGSDVRFGPMVDDERQQTIALHAREIEFFHPKTGVRTKVTAPVPNDPMDEPRLAPQQDASDVLSLTHGWKLISGL